MLPQRKIRAFSPEAGVHMCGAGTHSRYNSCHTPLLAAGGHITSVCFPDALCLFCVSYNLPVPPSGQGTWDAI